MKYFVKIVYIIYAIIFLIYLGLPNLNFPEPPTDSLMSNEPGDIENPSIRSYFTDYSREDIISHYKKGFSKNSILGIPMPTFVLNYPPEEAKIIIKQQTRSTFLQEIVHPLRESIFINGFEAKEEKDTIFINNKIWKYKINVKLVSSNILNRFVIGSLTLLLIPLLVLQWIKTFNYSKK